MDGLEFREMRKRIGLTQQALAEKLQCSRKHIIMLEGSATVPIVYALAMRTLYSMTLAEYAKA